jgi:cell division protein FtsB
VGLWEFILGLTLVSTLGWVANNWIRARHGYPIEDEDSNPSKRRMDAICAENQELKTQIKRLNERLAVVERIATDPAERTAREIEELR